jgi:flagellar hook-associated protein 1 FlgK
MAGGALSNILSKGSESLANSRVAVDVTGHNISNAHTPGYSRQIVNFESKMPMRQGLHVFGDGARVQSISRAHNNFLEGQIRKEIQHNGHNETLSNGLQKLENLFNPDLTSTIRDRFVSFSNSLRELSNYPEEPSTRINVIENGRALAQAFNSAYAGVVQVQSDSNEEVQQNIGSLNQKLKEVAILNSQIREMGAGGQSEVNDLEDKQDKLIKEIGSLIDINVYKDENDQTTIRGPNESLLVEGNHSSSLTLDMGFSPNNMPKVMVSEFDKPNYKDLTSSIHKGKIGALLEIRDEHAQELRQSINSLAKTFGEKFNSIHASGYGVADFSGTNGRTFFTGLDGVGEAGQEIAVNTEIASNPNSVSTAMIPDTAGDNVVVNKLVKMFYEPFGKEKDTTATGLYDKMIAQLGHQTAQAKEEAAASKVVFDKLKAQQEAFSGVSLDEEAASLLKYQHLFNASSKIITTANEMFQTVLDLKR